MIIELASPATLPFGLINHEGQPAILTLAIQHPPIQLYAQSKRRLHITGPRAHIAHAHAIRFLEYHRLSKLGEIEIELAIPAFMGLNGDEMLGLAVAQALAWAHDLNTEDIHQLASAIGLTPSHNGVIAAYQEGGLILTGIQKHISETAPIPRRVEIRHSERDAWAFVFHFPHPPKDTPDTYEADRLNNYLQTCQPAPASVVSEIFSAVEKDDIVAFGQGLMKLQTENHSSLPLESQAILNIMEENGAYAYGQSLIGYGLWGLVKGGDASRELRKKISDHVGFFGGRVMATITDNRGAWFVEKKGQLGMENPIRPKPGVS